MDDVCAYAPGADLYHNGSIHFSYGSGVIASYFYSIFGPHAQDEETIELVGTKGRMILTRHTGTLDIVSEYGREHCVLDCRDEHSGGTHFGADIELIMELRRFCDGAPPLVSAHSGLEATRMVMAAFKSMDGNGLTVQMAEIPDASMVVPNVAAAAESVSLLSSWLSDEPFALGGSWVALTNRNRYGDGPQFAPCRCLETGHGKSRRE